MALESEAHVITVSFALLATLSTLAIFIERHGRKPLCRADELKLTDDWRDVDYFAIDVRTLLVALEQHLDEDVHHMPLAAAVSTPPPWRCSWCFPAS